MLMVIAILSSKPLDAEKLKKLTSKPLDSINNVQISLGKKSELIVYPTDYPDSIIGVLKVMSIADSVVFVVNDTVSALDAELALAVEYSAIGGGMVFYDDYSDINSFSTLFAKYKVGKFQRSKNSIEGLVNTVNEPSAGQYVSIDKHFIVKGIGSVIIGFVVSGEIKKGDKLFLIPSGKPVTVKSIQLMDVDAASAGQGSHVGLALNNATEDDLSLNYCLSNIQETHESLSAKISFSEFYDKSSVFARSMSCAVFGNNFMLTLSESGNGITAKLNRKIVKPPGKYILADASRSVGKNRIVGSIEFI